MNNLFKDLATLSLRVKCIVGLLLVVVAIGVLVAVTHSDTPMPVSQKTSTTETPAVNSIQLQTSPTTEELIKAGTVLQMSQTADYKSISMTVTSADAQDAVSTGNLSKVADNGAKFLTIHMTLTNLLDTPITPIVRDNTFTLVTDSFKQISQDTTDVEAFGEDTLVDTQLNPDVPQNGYVLFEVPVDLHTGVIGNMNGTNNKFLGVRINF